MSARAMWKGVIRIGDARLPVRLFSAAQDRSVRFRLLHEEDGVPLRQRMVNPVTGNTVEHADARRGLAVEPEVYVVLTQEELASLEPEPSRDIRITRFVRPEAISHQWYDRPYFLGPDGDPEGYFALARALDERGREGVARWVMRKKQYLGALRAQGGHLLLMTLRHAEEVIAVDQLEPPEGRELEERERTMGERFIGALEDDFDPDEYEDRYREQVMRLVELKQKGGTVEIPERVEKEEAPEELAALLEESLARIG